VARVFFGMAWMHFLSDSMRTFGEMMENTFPFEFMLYSMVYLIIMIDDLMVARVYEKKDWLKIGANPFQRKDFEWRSFRSNFNNYASSSKQLC
jgi:hypothetical protein